MNETDSALCPIGGSIIHISLCSLVILLGVPGNCLIIRVYWTKSRKTSTHVLIMGLAWADLFACSLLIHAIVSNCIFGIGDTPTSLRILRYFLLSSVIVSVHMTSLIAFDRYDCVCRSKRRFFNHRRAVVAVLIAPIHSMAISSIYLVVLVNPSIVAPLVLCAVQIIFYTTALALIIVCYGTVYRTIRNHVKSGIGDERTNNRPRHTTLRQRKLAFVERESDDRVNSISLLAAAVKPNADTCEVQSVTDNIEHKLTDDTSSTSPATIRAKHSGFTRLKRTKSLRSRSDSGAPSAFGSKIPPPVSTSSNKVLQRKTTRMLLVTSVVFLLSWVPYWVYIASILARIQEVEFSDEANYALEKFAYIKYLNSAVNPIIYSLANRRFRKDCNDLFKKYRCC
ncbi:alpha-2Da adrenergic receptor-like [Patiria miniata]|uniref:G-protein coupled receptors family 1 profile domain-containing protein n=1 Tax=Patiria miniata TaxID=46514 RepID=A0A914AC75_PATMI|nr:alpha-2Da adrenergic receptor-like [Patiria miniata]